VPRRGTYTFSEARDVHLGSLESGMQQVGKTAGGEGRWWGSERLSGLLFVYVGKKRNKRESLDPNGRLLPQEGGPFRIERASGQVSTKTSSLQKKPVGRR